jgi:hypothetical protein
VGKRLGAAMPPIGQREISLIGIVTRRFQAIGDATKHDVFGYHGVLNHLGGLMRRNRGKC